MRTLMIMLFLAVFGSVGFCYAQEGDSQDAKKQIRNVDGQVSQTDWVSDKLVVDIGGDEMTFIVPDNVVVIRGTDELTPNDLDQNDSVTVYYYDDGVSGLKAVKITDNSPL